MTSALSGSSLHKTAGSLVETGLFVFFPPMTAQPPSIFTRIIAGEIPCEKILEDERFFAFLDIRPIAPGHTLVVPKVQTDKLYEVDDATLGGMLPFAARIARALEAAVPCKRVGMIVAGFEVPHAHLHLVPIQAEGELSFAHAKPASKEELAAVGIAVRAALEVF
jgi:histidine triad (HIT) family protein